MISHPGDLPVWPVVLVLGIAVFSAVSEAMGPVVPRHVTLVILVVASVALKLVFGFWLTRRPSSPGVAAKTDIHARRGMSGQSD